MSHFSEEEINEIRERLGLGSNAEVKDIKSSFNWEVEKGNLIETECGITLCRNDYFEGDKKHFTFDEALEIEGEAKKHGFRLPTVKDFEKLYAFYGVDDNGDDTPQRFIDELGFSHTGYYNSSGLYVEGTDGYYWSSSVYSAYYGYYLSFNTTFVSPQNIDDKPYGLALKFIYDPEGVKNERG